MLYIKLGLNLLVIVEYAIKLSSNLLAAIEYAIKLGLLAVNEYALINASLSLHNYLRLFNSG